MGAKVSKTIVLLRKLQHVLRRHVLIALYKAFTCPHLNYGDIIYNKAFNTSFQEKDGMYLI